MLLKIRHALLEVTNQPNAKKSAIVINNEIVITSASVLLPYLRPMQYGANSEGDVCASTKIIRTLQQCRPINAQGMQEGKSSDESLLLSALNYQVTFERKKLPESMASNRPPQILTRYRARALYLFSSAHVARHLLKVLHPFAERQDSGRPMSNAVLLSSFLVLSLCPHKEEKQTFQRFLLHIGHYVRYLTPINTLDDVLVMCSPFGLENFYKTISIGKISNVVGQNGCLFSISCALPPGCEGSAVFNKSLRLIGIIISTSFQRGDENINLTLAANFAYLLKDFMQQLNMPMIPTVVQRPIAKPTWECTMVVIEADGHQGSGTFVKVNNRKFILTCSHVIFKVSTKVSCRSVDGAFEADVIWRNPQYNKAFDIALLAAPHSIPDSYCVRLSQTKPAPGQTVYNAGFPYFVDFNLQYDFNPSIFEGRIIKCCPGAIMSDGCVQAGQSGGPMFDQHGCILGICVSNMKMDKMIYPNINTAIPVCEIRTTLEKYASTNDVSVLANLVANAEMQSVWSLDTPNILHKL